MKIDDRKILNDFKSPELREQSFRVIVDAYKRPLYQHIRKIVGNHEDADDALQNTFIKAWRYLDNFEGNSTIYTWLYRIAANEALTIIRKNKTKGAATLPDVLPGNTTDGPSSDTISRKLQVAINQLPDKQRLVFEMKYFQEMKYEEIALATKTTVGALKASYFHAVKKIEAFLTS
jgi:RNA polymerase sigma-70 factor (ECF subfamily)